jgi:hypothetical protein
VGLAVFLISPVRSARIRLQQSPEAAVAGSPRREKDVLG